MPKKRIRVGIVGLDSGHSWGAVAHLPALRSLPDDFEVVGVANRSKASSEAAAAATGLPRGFESVEQLVNSPDVDLVSVTVKVPHHKAIVSAAVLAGKSVYCEWPLGNGLAEARELADMARGRDGVYVAGTQGRMAPEVAHMRDLLAQGYVGNLLSTTLTATAIWFGPSIDKANSYLLDDAYGATMLTIAGGHMLSAFEYVMGPVKTLSAFLATRRATALIEETGETIERRSADQVLAQGLLASGAPVSIHYHGGKARGVGLTWDIHGDAGDLRLTGPGGHPQFVPLKLWGGQGEIPPDPPHGVDADRERGDLLAPIELPPTPKIANVEGPVVNVRRMYAALAKDLREGTRLAPSFDDALRTHELIDMIQRASDSGLRVDR